MRTTRVLTLTTVAVIAATTSFSGVATAAPTDASRPPAVTAGESAVPTTVPPSIRRGQRGTHVLVLQTALRREGHRIEGTGYFGSQTQNAVKRYQRAHRLKADGVVGRRTWQALGLYSIVGMPTPTLKPGDRRTGREQAYDDVLGTLLHLSIYYPTWADPGPMTWEADGRYSGSAVTTVKEFQRRVGLPATGVVDTRTGKQLMAFYGSGLMDDGC